MDADINFRERGKNVTIHENVMIISPEKIVLKDDILLSSFICIDGGTGLYIGSHTDLSFHSVVYGGGICFIDDFVSISAGCNLITGIDDLDESMLTNRTLPDSYRSFRKSFIYIQKHVFLAMNVVVYPGVVIGEGAVVGAGSIVTRSLPPWGVYIGSPPRKVRTRPKESIKLLERALYNQGTPASNFEMVFRDIFELSPLETTSCSSPVSVNHPIYP